MQFPLDEFEAEFPGGSPSLYVQRYGDKEAYPVPVDMDGASAYWTVTSADSAKPGHLRCELQWAVDSVVVKSDIYGFYFLKAIDIGQTPPDEPTKRWTDQIDGKIGDLSQLETDAKDNLVSAINEAASALREAVQSDLNQNDETQPDYVKNRPCVIGEDGALTWIVPPVSDETILNALKEIDALPVVAEDGKIFTVNQKILFW